MLALIDDLRLLLPGSADHKGLVVDDFGEAALAFAILEGGRIDWETYLEALTPLLAESADTCVVFYQPWWPGVQRRLQAFRDHKGWIYEEIAGRNLATMPSKDLPQLFQVRKACGGHHSGLWLVLAPRVKPEQLKRDLVQSSGFGPPLGLALDVADDLAAALAFDEGAWSTLIVRADSRMLPSLLTLHAQIAEGSL